MFSHGFNFDEKNNVTNNLNSEYSLNKLPHCLIFINY